MKEKSDMEFNLNENKEVVALLGAGSMGTAIIKRIKGMLLNMFTITPKILFTMGIG